MLDPGIGPREAEAEEKPERKPATGFEGFVELVFGPQPTDEDILERAKVMHQAQFERWRDDTSATVRIFWPGWAVGWVIGLVVVFACAAWANVRRGFMRHNSGPWDDEDDGD